MSKRKGKWISLPGGGRIGNSALRHRTALIIGASLVLFIATVGVIQGLTIVLNPTQVTVSMTWSKSSNAGDTSKIINDITTATVSGTIYCFVDWKPLSFVGSDSVTYTFSRVVCYVYAKAGTGYATTPTKTYVGSAKTGPSSGGWYSSLLTVDTTQVPNGDYLFKYGPEFADSGGTTPDGGYFSVFYASFSTGSMNGNNGGGETSAPAVDYTLQLLAVAAVVVVVFADILILFYLRTGRLKIPSVRRR